MHPVSPPVNRNDAQPDHENSPPPAPRRIAIAGASGLVGTALGEFLLSRGHRVDSLVRRAPKPRTTEIRWDPTAWAIDAEALEGTEAVVNLAGASIAGGRWTPARKTLILESRTEGTRLLSETISRLRRRPAVLISASAIGYYGDRGDAILTEQSEAGAGFLAEVCKAWEAATEPAREAGVRVINLRIGVVLTTAGGALGRMLPAVKLGLGGRLGNGRQYMSWIAIDDLTRAIEHLIFAENVNGPVNAVAPSPVTNAEFTRTLGRVLRRPTWLGMPAVAVRLAFGEMGREVLLAGARVLPTKLQTARYRFIHPELEGALRRVLGKA